MSGAPWIVPSLFLTAVAVLDLGLITRDRLAWRVVSKPLLVPILAWLAFCLSPDVPVALLIALGFCRLGDVFLLKPGNATFLAGLGSFLFGHVAYVVVFVGILPASVPPLTIAFTSAIVFVLCATMFIILRPWKHGMSVPVAAYVVAIGSMGGIALLTLGRLPLSVSVPLTAGAVLFMASDAILGYKRFVAHFPGDEVMLMALYIAAQVGIVIGGTA